MKICYILPHFYPHVGGGEQAFFDLILNLKKLKNVEIIVVTSASGGIIGEHEHLGIKIISYPWKIFFGHPIVEKKDIEKHIKWADIVHIGVYSPVIPAVNVCNKYGKPSIVTVHEVLRHRWFWIESNPIKALLFLMYEKINVNVNCNYYHTPSMATNNDLIIANKKAKVKNIYWISDKDISKVEKDKQKYLEFFNIKKNNIVFLNYGRPGKTKGIFVYLNAIKKVVDVIEDEKLSNIRFCFIMANDPIKEKNKFKKLIGKYNLSKYVIVKDSVSREDLNNYIECADYVVVPSITEGFGLTAIEACERNKKIIHSSGGSLPEVTFGSTLQFENKNSDDLAKKITDVILDKKVFTRKTKKDFSKTTIVNEFYDLYKNTIEERKNV